MRAEYVCGTIFKVLAYFAFAFCLVMPRKITMVGHEGNASGHNVKTLRSMLERSKSWYGGSSVHSRSSVLLGGAEPPLNDFSIVCLPHKVSRML